MAKAIHIICIFVLLILYKVNKKIWDTQPCHDFTVFSDFAFEPVILYHTQNNTAIKYENDARKHI